MTRHEEFARRCIRRVCGMTPLLKWEKAVVDGVIDWEYVWAQRGLSSGEKALVILADGGSITECLAKCDTGLSAAILADLAELYGGEL